MLKKYLIRFFFRCSIFLITLYLYLFQNQWLSSMIFPEFLGPITPFHVLWAIFVFIMVIHLLPNWKITMAGRKTMAINYVQDETCSKEQLLEFVQRQNIRAWTVMLVWVFFNAVWAALYLSDVIGRVDLFMLTVFYYASDLICMLVFCPFQRFIMKNRCCVNCRVFDWGHFMMFTPMLFIRSFFSWSLFFLSLVVLIRWELIYAKHPERFYYGTNATLRCENCKDKICKIKRPYLPPKGRA